MKPMRLIYIYHSGFIIESKEFAILIDYYRDTGNTLLETGKTGHPVYPVRRYPRQPKGVFSRCHFPKKRRRMER